MKRYWIVWGHIRTEPIIRHFYKHMSVMIIALFQTLHKIIFSQGLQLILTYKNKM